MAIEDLMIGAVDLSYYDAGFRTVLEDHLTYFRNHPQTQPMAVQSMDKEVFEFDFYGMLTQMKIARELHYVTMRLAGLTSPTDSFKDLEVILVPDATVVNKRLQAYRTKKRA